jgi:hypothetical protein
MFKNLEAILQNEEQIGHVNTNLPPSLFDKILCSSSYKFPSSYVEAFKLAMGDLKKLNKGLHVWHHEDILN